MGHGVLGTSQSLCCQVRGVAEVRRLYKDTPSFISSSSHTADWMYPIFSFLWLGEWIQSKLLYLLPIRPKYIKKISFLLLYPLYHLLEEIDLDSISKPNTRARKMIHRIFHARYPSSIPSSMWDVPSSNTYYSRSSPQTIMTLTPNKKKRSKYIYKSKKYKYLKMNSEFQLECRGK